MKYVKVFLAMLALLVPAIADAQWTHEPAGSTVLLDCPLTTISGCARVVDQYGNLNSQSVTNAADPVSPPGGIYVSLPYSGPCGNSSTIGTYLACANGGGTMSWFHTTQLRELYVGIIAKTNEQEGCNIVGTSKDWFIMSYNNTGGAPIANGFFGSSNCGSTKTHIFGPNTGGVDNSHACAGGGLRCDPNRSAGTYQANTMVKHQYCLRAATSSTSRDGVVAWSLNDVWAGVYTNLNYAGGNLNEVQWNKTLDGYGNGQGFTGELRQEMYHPRVSAVPSGGCASIAGGTPPADTTPPGRATGLTITQLN